MRRCQKRLPLSFSLTQLLENIILKNNLIIQDRSIHENCRIRMILSKHIAVNLMSMNDFHQNMRLACTKNSICVTNSTIINNSYLFCGVYSDMIWVATSLPESVVSHDPDHLSSNSNTRVHFDVVYRMHLVDFP